MQLQDSRVMLKETNPKQVIQGWLVKQLSEQLSLDTKTINITEPLTRYGLDSIDAVTLVGDLEDALDLELPSTLFWDHPTIEKSAQFLVENFELSQALSNLESETLESTASSSKSPEPVAANTDKKGWGNLWGMGSKK
jgi:acyl carrier protein